MMFHNFLGQDQSCENSQLFFFSIDNLPYGCDKCTYKASSLSNLNLHRKKMHEISYNLSKAEFIEMIQNGNHPYCDSRFLAMINESVI